ncbi:type IX secretion system protein PorQ [Wenyingzhuangia sp. chi5]|uniref:Type IX secretion system protein PorQ n=1 Tax=Wenyingzhuangia gilva TaxID=3057677 RepID=A0ABT8VRE3_9FLAO|nr:type IX secretion system protein PorQ [Wenyingzhuangia sp. chi5]MDO3694550.1 type IX secretion system protein PorQ [Wenyingzhuangia sp. chi5]
MKYIIFLFSALISSSLFSQTGGETLYSFLNIPTSAKQVALGGVTLTSRDDVSQTLWNPSSVNLKMENDLSLNYIKYISGINVGSLSYAKSINPSYGTAFFGVQYFDYGDLERTDASGPTVLGVFSARDLSFNLGYGYTFQSVSFGASLKYISSKIDTYTSSALLYDLGITYIHPTKPLVMSLVLRNSGNQLTQFIDDKEPVNNNVIFAIEYRLEHVPIKVYGAIDELNNWNISEPNPSRSKTDLENNVTPETISDINNALRHVSIGAELWPEKMINVRIGYNHRRSQEYQLNEVRTGAGLSYGFGFNTKFLRFDYAYAKFQEGAKYSTFGLTVHL